MTRKPGKSFDFRSIWPSEAPLPEGKWESFEANSQRAWSHPLRKSSAPALRRTSPLVADGRRRGRLPSKSRGTRADEHWPRSGSDETRLRARRSVAQPMAGCAANQRRHCAAAVDGLGHTRSPATERRQPPSERRAAGQPIAECWPHAFGAEKPTNLRASAQKRRMQNPSPTPPARCNRERSVPNLHRAGLDRAPPFTGPATDCVFFGAGGIKEQPGGCLSEVAYEYGPH